MPPTSKRQSGKAPNPAPETRTRSSDLLDVAESVFQRRGYYGATIQEIAGEFGILKGSIYHYVRSKEDLLAKVEERLHRLVLGEVESLLAGVDDPIGRVWTFVYVMVKANADKPSMGALASAALELPRGKNRTVILRARKRFETLLLELLDEAKDEGVLRNDIDTKVAAYGVLGMANSVYIWFRSEGPVDSSWVAKTLADVTIGGLRKGAGPNSAQWLKLAQSYSATVDA